MHVSSRWFMAKEYCQDFTAAQSWFFLVISRVFVNLETSEKTYKGNEYLDPMDGYVCFHNSELMCGRLGKATLGGGNKSSLFQVDLCGLSEQNPHFGLNFSGIHIPWCTFCWGYAPDLHVFHVQIWIFYKLLSTQFFSPSRVFKSPWWRICRIIRPFLLTSFLFLLQYMYILYMLNNKYTILAYEL